MTLSEKILSQIPFVDILKYVEKKQATSQKCANAGKGVGASPRSRKATEARLTLIFGDRFEVKTNK